MAYNKKTWKDRVSEQPQRRILVNVDNNEEMTVDVTRFEGIVVQEGDAFSANNMNDLENRIKNTFDSDEATLNAVNNKANTNATNISSLQSSVNSVSGRVTTNANNISGLTTRMTAVESKANTNENSITNINRNLDSLDYRKAPNYHASPSTTFGIGKKNEFGHLKITDGAYEGNASAGMAASSDLVGVVNDKVDNNYNDLKGELTANGNRIYMDYQNGKYGYNTSANRGADTFHPFSSYEIEGTPILNEIWFDAGEHTFSFSAEAQSYYLVTVGGACSNGIAEFRSITGVTSTLMSISGTLFSGFMNTYIVYTQNASTVNVTTYVNDEASNRGIGCTVVKFK